VNAQLICDAGDLTMSLALALPDLEHGLDGPLPELIGVLLLCWHGSASFQVSEPPDSPGGSILPYGVESWKSALKHMDDALRALV
jgi:hypothetical protein